MHFPKMGDTLTMHYTGTVCFYIELVIPCSLLAARSSIAPALVADPSSLSSVLVR